MTTTRPKVFYGWWVAVTAALGLFLNTATIIAFPFGFFAKAIGQEFQSGRAGISLAFTIHNLTAALCGKLAGRLADRYGPRRILLPCTVGLGLILVSSRLLSGAIWQLYVFYLALGVVSGGAGAMAYTDVVSHWFDRRRGLALSVMMLGMGLGAIVIPLVAQRLIAALGWRIAYNAFGVSVLLIALPVVATYLKERPENMGLLPDGATDAKVSRPAPASEAGLTLREAVRTRELWIMVCGLFLVTASVHACFIHLPAILTDRGNTAQLAAFASSLFGVGLFLGRVGCGYLLDQIFAWIWAVFGVSGGLGAYLMGFGFDKTGSYFVPLVGFLCAAVLATLLILSLGPYRYRLGRT